MKQTLFECSTRKLSLTLNIISETRRAPRPLLIQNNVMSPDQLDASLGMKKKKTKDIKKKRTPSGGKRKTNPWIEHIQWYRKEHPELSYKEAMK